MNAAPPALLGERIAPDGTAVGDNFANWFGRSKVVDSNGSARQVFHGTRRVFTSFDPMCLGRNVDNPTTRMGFFFTEDPSGAERWATRSPNRRTVQPDGPSAPLIIPVYLSIQKPQPIKAAKFMYFLRSAREATIDRFVEEASAKGFDGFRIDYDATADARRGLGDDALPAEVWWVAFSGSQIKSSLGNSGLFDTESDDIADSHDWDVPAARERMRA